MRINKIIISVIVLLLFIIRYFCITFAGVESVQGGIKFSYYAPDANAVFLAGDFNGWNPMLDLMHKQEDGWWTIIVPLEPGKHEYKFVVDGNWFADPDNPVTGGEYGNSIIVVTTDGSLVPQKPISNTPLSGKVFFEGRYISTYLCYPEEPNRWKLKTPAHDINLSITARLSDNVSATGVMNINNKTEQIELWKTHLSFLRGNIHAKTDNLEVIAFDNQPIPIFEDPLHLFGNIGIYDYPYGYNTRGVLLQVTFPWKISSQFLISDDSRATVDYPGGITVSGTKSVYQKKYGYGQMDVIGVRVNKKGNIYRFGTGYRKNRGYHPGILFEPPSYYYRTLQSMSMKSVDIEFTVRKDIGLYFEYLFGDEIIQSHYSLSEEQSVSKQWELDNFQRIIFGGKIYDKLPVQIDYAYEIENHRFSEFKLDTVATCTPRLSTLRSNIAYQSDWLNSQIKTTYEIMSMPEYLPWKENLWFNDEWHGVPYHKYTLVGYQKALVIEPIVELKFFDKHRLTIETHNRIVAYDWNSEIKFFESLFKLNFNLLEDLRFYNDTRLAKFDDDFLKIHDTYISSFYELVYEITPGIQLSISYGVDPYVIDPVTNEYEYRGRDDFLAEKGAGIDTVKNDYVNLGREIEIAENALKKETRITLEGKIIF